ncbi:MAG: DegT/DnrJ/EryC1/StrS aminotransferase family protein [candidate division Zixibacteria bacterium]|nr:DegT/DnrJ/EryC1/StrS aminotransferase family protein [candidate division Zixibacteria bacterium]
MGNDVKNAEKKIIPITKPQFDESEEQAVIDVLRSGWVVQGPKVAEFEGLFAEFTGAKNAIAVSSCTTALQLALIAHSIGPGDKVLMPSLTYIATANAVEYVGATPVFVDIDPATLTIDPDDLRACLKANHTSDIKAIIPVSLFGLCSDMPAVNALAQEYNLIVIEDAACGMGAYRENHHAGTEASAAVFSLHPRKAITTGEGGMIITDDDDKADLMRKLRNHGASASDLERHLKEGGSLLPEFNLLGYNYRMTDIQGAIGVEQMKKAKNLFNARRKVAARYDEMLKGIKGIYSPFIPDGFISAYQSYVCYYKFDPQFKSARFDRNQIQVWNKERNQLMAGLESEGITVRQGTHAVHTLGYYRNKYNLTDFDFPFAFIADRLSITLPLYPGMPKDDQKRVVETLKSLL